MATSKPDGNTRKKLKGDNKGLSGKYEIKSLMTDRDYADSSEDENVKGSQILEVKVSLLLQRLVTSD